MKLWMSKNIGKELAICGENAVNELSKVNSEFHPNLIIAGSTKNSSLPFLSNRFDPTKTLFYLCENKSCLQPENSFENIKTKTKL
jgi:uncharacterized protein YyaL (SSP411 family)